MYKIGAVMVGAAAVWWGAPDWAWDAAMEPWVWWWVRPDSQMRWPQSHGAVGYGLHADGAVLYSTGTNATFDLGKAVYGPSHADYLVPNLDVEGVEPAHPYRAVLCKTKVCVRTLRQMGVPRVRYVGFTTRSDVGVGGGEGRYGRWLHLAGQSPWKGTGGLLEAWRAHPEWPILTVFYYGWYLDSWYSEEDEARANLRWIRHKVPGRRIRAMQRDHGVQVCLSRAEGWGHTLHEAQSAGAVILALNGEPMNESVVDGVSGVLIPATLDPATVRSAPPLSYPTLRWTPTEGGYWVADGPMVYPEYRRPTVSEIEAGVERILAMSYVERARLGMAARSAWEAERAAFYDNWQL